MLHYPSFFINIEQPIVWTLHDMNPFLGCAHFMHDHNIVKDTKEDKEIIKIKREALKQKRCLAIVPLCNWMETYSKRSEVFKNRIHRIIPNSINTEIFKTYPDSRDELKQSLNIPKDKYIFMFCSHYLNNPRKGFDILLESVIPFKDNAFFIIVGHSDGDFNLPYNKYRSFGMVSDEKLMAKLYTISDAFLLPSREDNLPNTMLESLCCGTPVISTPNGGMVNTITNWKNGIIAKEASVSSFKEAIQLFINNHDTFNREFIAESSRKKFSPATQAHSYLKLYEELISKSLNHIQ